MKTVFRTTLTFTVACLALLAVTAASPVPDGLTTPDAVTTDELAEPLAFVCIDADTGMMRDCADWYTHREVLDDGTIVRQSCKLVREYTRSDSISILWGLIDQLWRVRGVVRLRRLR